MSDKKWKSWCRLCARIDGGVKLDLATVKTVSDILKKYFHISISIADNCQLVTCQDCLDLVLSAGQFAHRCAKVSLMFWELSNGKFAECEADSVRKMYGLEEHSSVHFKEEEVGSPQLKVQHLQIEYAEEDFQSEHVDSDENFTGSVQNEDIYAEDNTGSDIVENIEPLDADDVFMEQLENGDGNCEEDATVSDQGSDRIEMLDDVDKADIDYQEMPKKRRKRGKNKPKEQEGFTCTMCNMKFIGPKWYERHVKTRHSSKSARNFACSKCSKSFAHRYALKEHEAIHLPDELRILHTCTDCGKTYKTSANLRRHIGFVHTRELVCVCEECGKEFADMGTLRYHRLVHIQERPSQCTVCPKSFKDKSHLKKHMETHSDIKYECPDCRRLFNTKRSLLSHTKWHNGEKIHKCHLCKFAFKRAYSLRKHLIVHSGSRPCPCSYCDKAFTDASRKRYHERIYHPKEYALQMAELLIGTE